MALASGRLPKARELLNQAIEIAAAIQFMPLLLKALTGMAQVYTQTAEAERAITLATFVQQHRATDDATRAQATALHQNLMAQRLPETATAVPATEPPDFQGILELLEIGRSGD